MENQSFEGEPPNGNSSKDLKDNPTGPSKPRTDPSSSSNDQVKRSIPTLSSIIKDNPIYAEYVPPKQNPDDSTDVEPTPLESVQEKLNAHYTNPPKIHLQYVPGPFSAIDPRQQAGNVDDLEEQSTNIDDPEEKAANVPAARLQPPSLWATCVDFYKRANGFAFQWFIHAFLLTWPVSTALMGAVNANNCHLNPYLPYLMLVVGLLGTAAGTQRIYVLHYENIVRPDRPINFWPGVRAAEFIIWVLFAVQLCLFFDQKPSFIYGQKYYCKRNVYTVNFWLICLTSAIMIGWIAVNIGNLIAWFSRRNIHPKT